jgi:hypothetical protein
MTLANASRERRTSAIAETGQAGRGGCSTGFPSSGLDLFPERFIWKLADDTVAECWHSIHCSAVTKRRHLNPGTLSLRGWTTITAVFVLGAFWGSLVAVTMAISD